MRTSKRGCKDGFLLFNLSHIGDILFTTPAVRAIKESNPDAHVACVVLEGLEDVLRHNPFVDEVISRRRGFSGGTRLLSRTRGGRFGTSIVFSFSAVDAAAIGWLSGAHRRIGFDQNGLGRFLTHPVTFRSDAHRVDAYLDLARAAGAEIASPKMEMYISDEDRRVARDLLLSSGVDITRPIVALSPGSTVVAKQWFTERYAALADRFAGEGYAVVVVGSAGERASVEDVLHHAKSSVTNLAGRTGIAQLAAVLAQCGVVVTNDTGPMHMAVSVGTPVTTIFGPTDPQVTGPYTKDAVVLWERLDCFPCGYARDCSRECMAAVTVEEVFAASARLCSERPKFIR
jgi:lipopolysaccharide heptosyltransferase II